MKSKGNPVLKTRFWTRKLENFNGKCLYIPCPSLCEAVTMRVCFRDEKRTPWEVSAKQERRRRDAKRIPVDAI